MKKYLFSLVWLLSSLLPGYSLIATAALYPVPNPERLPRGVHLVIGVFAIQDNADNFSQYARTQGVSAQYAYHPPRGYYYVYTFSSDSPEPVVDQCMQLRSSTEFTDAWVFKPFETQDVPLIATEITESESMPDLPEAPVVERGPGYAVYFETLGKRNKPVPAVVRVIDGVRAQEVTSCTAHQADVLEHDKLLSNQVQLIPHAIGYHKTTFDLSLTEPVTDSTASYVSVGEDSVIRVTMPLEKLKRGDIQVMYNTYFYGNASVMREQSRYELAEMQHYLENNPEVRVKLHGHTNGDSRGVTYLYVPEYGNFFDLRRSDDYVRKNVGANKLSKMRAETIRDYLIKQGISEDRIETEGWGGDKMLHDAESPLAKQNIRVEMEVLSE